MTSLRLRSPGFLTVIALTVLGLAWVARAASAQVGRPGADHALLINGGDRPATNYLSHLEHLQAMVDVLGRRGIPTERIHVFSGDGEDPAPDLTTRESAPPDFWLIENTAIGKRLRPSSEIVNTAWHGVRLYPARLAALRQWFDAARTAIPAGDRLLVFVTDHGERGRADAPSGAITLWHERVTVAELRALLDRLSPRVQVVTAMSQCYSGAFAQLMYEVGSAEPSGNTCGVFSTSSEEKAYGCYPEAQGADRIGHAFEFIAALGQQASVADAHAQVLLSDNTPDRPLRTSDMFLARLVADEAAARGVDPDALTDSLLAAAWRHAADVEPEIRMLDAVAGAFGTFSPRSLSEVHSRGQDLALLAEQLNAQKTRWTGLLNSARENMLRDFLRVRADWRARLDDPAINDLAAPERAALVPWLLQDLASYAAQTPGWSKLQRYHDGATQAADAGWRFGVRAAVADRTRTILIRIAGRELLARDAGRVAQRQALESLLQCEAMQPGGLPAQSQAVAVATARAAFPSIADEIRILEELQPSWFGATTGPIGARLRKLRPALAGGAQVQVVEEGSPAAEAGLAPGDVILGPPQQPFKNPRELQEWVVTAPRDVPAELAVFRPGAGAEGNERLIAVYLRGYPAERPESGVPPQPGGRAPALRDSLKAFGAAGLPDLSSREHLLFFWATWCAPCKAAVPEVMAFAAARGVPVVAITDEDEAAVSAFRDRWTRPFFDTIALDTGRATFKAYAVSGTPTVVLVDGGGTVEFRQVGYLAKDGLKIEGWRWPRR